MVLVGVFFLLFFCINRGAAEVVNMAFNYNMVSVENKMKITITSLFGTVFLKNDFVGCWSKFRNYLRQRLIMS